MIRDTDVKMGIEPERIRKPRRLQRTKRANLFEDLVRLVWLRLERLSDANECFFPTHDTFVDPPQAAIFRAPKSLIF